MKKLFVLTVLLYSYQPLYSQSNRITGKVVDQGGNPIAYASITFKGSGKFGAWTLPDGTFDTFVPQKSDTIVCTHVNFKKAFESTSGNNFITFVLEKKESQENVITILGTHKYSKQEIDKRQRKNPVVDEARTFIKVEIEADFPGGQTKLTKYLQEHISYPDSASISDVNGIVKVGFVIDIDGYPKKITLLKGVNKFADEVVIKAISSMPKWNQAMQNGRYIEFYREIAVLFKIEGTVD